MQIQEYGRQVSEDLTIETDNNSHSANEVDDQTERKQELDETFVEESSMDTVVKHTFKQIHVSSIHATNEPQDEQVGNSSSSKHPFKNINTAVNNNNKMPTDPKVTVGLPLTECTY